MTYIANALASLAGEWTGTNKMRQLPEDPYTESPATAVVRPAARSRLVTLSYTWRDDDTDQDGFMLLSDGGEPGTVLAVWCDSWHQSPQWMTCRGELTEAGVVTVSGEYGTPADPASWRITVDPGDGTALQMAMDNVLPDSDYQVAEATYHRTA